MCSSPATLPPAVAGERHELDTPAGRVGYYRAGVARAGRALLLVHSVNAAASAYEVRPLFEHYRFLRPVYALDLPGYGCSQRGDRPYTPRLMTDAVAALADRVHREHGPADAMALSLSCEFLARAAVESPHVFASLALVSPTGFNGDTPRRGPPGSTRARPGMYRIVASPGLSQALFALLTSRASIAYFLRRTFGSDRVDPGLVDYAYLTSHRPGARHAPLRFLSGYLFSGDAFTLYESLRLPVWLAHGVRGDFQDYRLTRLVADRPGWTVQVFRTGALPHFELLSDFTTLYDEFTAGLVHAA